MRRICVSISRRQLVPLFSTISILNIYPSQTKILEGLTKEEIRIFEALLQGVSTLFGLRIVEKFIENRDFIFCQSFQNLRLGSITFHKSVNHESRLTNPSKIFVLGNISFSWSGCDEVIVLICDFHAT